MPALVLLLLAAIVPVVLPSKALPCDGRPDGDVQYWQNQTGQTVYVKQIKVDHQADAALIADAHVTVWVNGAHRTAAAVLTAPWDRYDMTPKPAVILDLSPDWLELAPGDHLAFQAQCTALAWVYGTPMHHPSYAFYYTVQP